MHVHSGKIKGMFSTTNPLEIQQFVEQNLVNFFSRLIFTTYHSLHKIQESGINVDTIYFDEAHTTQYKKTFSLLLITSHSMQVDAISLLLHQSIVVLLSRQV